MGVPLSLAFLDRFSEAPPHSQRNKKRQSSWLALVEATVDTALSPRPFLSSCVLLHIHHHTDRGATVQRLDSKNIFYSHEVAAFLGGLPRCRSCFPRRVARIPDPAS